MVYLYIGTLFYFTWVPSYSWSLLEHPRLILYLGTKLSLSLLEYSRLIPFTWTQVTLLGFYL